MKYNDPLCSLPLQNKLEEKKETRRPSTPNA